MSLSITLAGDAGYESASPPTKIEVTAIQDYQADFGAMHLGTQGTAGVDEGGREVVTLARNVRVGDELYSSSNRNFRPPAFVSMVSSCDASPSMPDCTRARSSPVDRRSSASTP
jgi:hypothetical protein